MEERKTEAPCPHCGKTIQVVGSAELQDEFGMYPQTISNARERGVFPEPWLFLGNRYIYLRESIQEYNDRRLAERIDGMSPAAAEQQIMVLLKKMPAKAKKEMIERLKA